MEWCIKSYQLHACEFDYVVLFAQTTVMAMQWPSRPAARDYVNRQSCCHGIGGAQDMMMGHGACGNCVDVYYKVSYKFEDCAE